MIPKRYRFARWVARLLLVFACVTAVRAQQPITFQYVYDDLGNWLKSTNKKVSGTFIDNLVVMHKCGR